MFLTFFGAARGDKHTHEHAHESPKVMLVPLAVLAVGAIFSGMVFYKPFFGDHHKVEVFFGITQEDEDHAVGYGLDGISLIAPAHAATSADSRSDADAVAHDSGEDKLGRGAIYMAPSNTVLDDAHHVHWLVKLSPFIAMVLGFAVAWAFYMTKLDLPRRVAESNPVLYRFLLNKWYFDEIYDVIFLRPAQWLGRSFWKIGDGKIIDGGINGLAMGIIPFFTKWAGRMQSGYIFTYAFGMVIGIAALVTWMTIAGGK
jgi:NADH-quinone oxidoreductase subunit L